MGLLNKLKNVLFEEEEIEETVIEEPTTEIPKATMELPKINREPKKEKPVVKYDVEDEPDRELFKVERTFDFPAFDEDEFEDFASLKKEEPEKKEEKEVREPRINKIKSKEYTPTRVVKSVEEPEPKKQFKPSPVISPVYGILDKNYKKEDVLTKEEANDKKNVKLDVDSVRKKAFGTLEEDLAATINETVEEFYNDKDEIKKIAIEIEKIEEPVEKEETIEKIIKEDNKLEDLIETPVEKTSELEEIFEEPIEEDTNLDNLLENTIDEEIDVTKEMEMPSRLDKVDYEEVQEDKEDEIINEEYTFEAKLPDLNKNYEKEEVSEDTLENDLFELIDSMYENGDEEE